MDIVDSGLWVVLHTCLGLKAAAAAAVVVVVVASNRVNNCSGNQTISHQGYRI